MRLISSESETIKPIDQMQLEAERKSFGCLTEFYDLQAYTMQGWGQFLNLGTLMILLLIFNSENPSLS